LAPIRKWGAVKKQRKIRKDPTQSKGTKEEGEEEEEEEEEEGQKRGTSKRNINHGTFVSH